MKTSILFNKHSWPASHVLRAAETEGTLKQRQNKGKHGDKSKLVKGVSRVNVIDGVS